MKKKIRQINKDKKYCRHCGNELTPENWFPCFHKLSTYVCKTCWNDYNEYRKTERFIKRMDKGLKDFVRKGDKHD